MSGTLAIDYAAQTEAGNKAENADAADALIPGDGQLLSKGIAAAIADGMSSSEGGREASQLCVSGFLNDYFSTPESWTVRTSASKVLGALNRWLFANGQQRYDSARGMVTTFTGLVLKSATAHVFHVGDSRLYLYRDEELEQLTRDHRVWVSKDRDFLSRAMGIDATIDIDYKALAVEPGDIFLFTTDGISGHVTDNRLRDLLREYGVNLQACAKAMLEESLRNGSTDNVTCQLVRVRELPTQTEDDILQQITELPFPPDLSPGMKIDGYEILRELHASRRSEVFLANDSESGEKVILKTPSVNYRDDPAYLEGFLHEEWVGKRIRNPHVLRVLDTPKRRFLYNVSEFIEGQSLRQWITDHPQTHINKARDFLNQLAEGLRAFHRLEMAHLDLKPENVLIDQREVLRIIDFGSTHVAGASEITRSFTHGAVQGTVNYSAPECAVGHCSNRSDIFSLGVIAYELLTGALPYGDSERIRAADKLRYVPASQHNPHIQPWVDGALRKAVHPNPARRYDSLSEFLYDLSHPNDKFVVARSAPLIERDPLGFWRGLSALLLLGNLLLLYLLSRG
ncbi:MAG: bifunctional protein-serine/threonine kinase/phosphatase [Chromatiaceae bacterium]|nr:bifunctional protein-serine/threonine kinase/phosphatase [Chromatiaceae bacterium]MCP5430504.1 bifunctional protein-serine/threonine kinase/phosphatase [Chromatiaceae bacterium]MCP5434900.1 bifunctional protein-serine/threonine kinase/phosphatase [Chromatiaceae bacterium]MCW5584565.1 bifunctional protein-serine/threonine kinase/phosphatase [Chromatiales bacterium]